MWQLELADARDVLQMSYDLERQIDGDPLHIDPELVQFINILTMDAVTLKKAKSSCSASNESRLTLIVALTLQKIIRSRQREYGTSIAEDSILLQNSSVRDRKTMAIEIRHGEKEILAATLQALEKRVESLRTSNSETGKPLPFEKMEEPRRNTKRRRI